ncbi:MAG: hypothetical protein ACRD6W_07080 [Nitrososphaerales archaeon]
MTTTAVGYPNEPSRRAMIVASAAAAVAGWWAGKRLTGAAKAIAPALATAMVKPLATFLTTLGI